MFPFTWFTGARDYNEVVNHAHRICILYRTVLDALETNVRMYVVVVIWLFLFGRKLPHRRLIFFF